MRNDCRGVLPSEGRHKFFSLIFRIFLIGFKLHLDLILTHHQDEGTVPIPVYLFDHYNNIKLANM